MTRVKKRYPIYRRRPRQSSDDCCQDALDLQRNAVAYPLLVRELRSSDDCEADGCFYVFESGACADYESGASVGCNS